MVTNVGTICSLVGYTPNPEHEWQAHYGRNVTRNALPHCKHGAHEISFGAHCLLQESLLYREIWAETKIMIEEKFRELKKSENVKI